MRRWGGSNQIVPLKIEEKGFRAENRPPSDLDFRADPITALVASVSAKLRVGPVHDPLDANAAGDRGPLRLVGSSKLCPLPSISV
jgi:hypothetical protein